MAYFALIFALFCTIAHFKLSALDVIVSQKRFQWRSNIYLGRTIILLALFVQNYKREEHCLMNCV